MENHENTNVSLVLSPIPNYCNTVFYLRGNSHLIPWVTFTVGADSVCVVFSFSFLLLVGLFCCANPDSFFVLRSMTGSCT